MRVTPDGSLFGLAPGGVYPAICVTTNAVRSYRTISPLPKCRGIQAVYFLRHFPSVYTAQALTGTLPYGARTFLPIKILTRRLSGQLSKPDTICPRRYKQDQLEFFARHRTKENQC